MNDRDGSPASSPKRPGSDLILPKVRSPEKAVRPASEFGLPFRRSNASLSALFASTSSGFPNPKRASSPLIGAGTTPAAVDVPESIFTSGLPYTSSAASNDYKSLIVRSFVPHIAVLASADTDQLLAQKGFPGGFLELVRPYGENIQGKVTIRDITGSSKTWEDFAVRFVKLRDGLESPRFDSARSSTERRSSEYRNHKIDGYLDQYFPHSSARLRTGGDIGHVEDAVDKHLSYSLMQDGADSGYEAGGIGTSSPFHQLYLRRLLSGLPMVPHETFSHPVACVIAISSRNADPIEELRQLYTSTNTGDQRLPQWVNNDYLRYYVLVHDEEHDDVQRTTSLFEQMKRHFGLHCHLLRIRSTQCVPSDDGCERLPMCEWISAAEELSEIQKRESIDDIDDFGPCLYESDATAVKNFVREMVTQSVIPIMERLCATWNDQVVSRRRGISARFLSLSKKWAPFGGSSKNSSSNPNASNSNYDSLQGFYRPDSAEAIMRKLSDYAFMLRDFKLAQSTYEFIRSDYSNDKAWKYYAGANEMSAITALINLQPLTTKSRAESMDQMIETACYSYITRCSAPFNALRTLAVSLELLNLRGGTAADDAARWASRVLELELVGPVGHSLFSERVAACYASSKGTGSHNWGSRRRKAALWSTLAVESWLNLEKPREAEACLVEVFKFYDITSQDTTALGFNLMREYLLDLREALSSKKGDVAEFDAAVNHLDGLTVPKLDEESERLDLDVKSRRASLNQPVSPKLSFDQPAHLRTSVTHEKVDIKSHRKSLIGITTSPMLQDPLNASSSVSEHEQSGESGG